jgi:hypothetical protein
MVYGAHPSAARIPTHHLLWKVIVWEKVLGWGSTDPITGMIADWAGMILTANVGSVHRDGCPNLQAIDPHIYRGPIEPAPRKPNPNIAAGRCLDGAGRPRSDIDAQQT